MSSILKYFDETKKEKPKNIKYFSNDVFEHIPSLDYPKVDTYKFLEDLREVERCHYNPSMSTSFLRSSDKNVSGVFRDYCESNGYKNIDWKKIDEILRDINTVVDSLKENYNRPRPFHYLEDIKEYKEKYFNSPSYPSGHTCIAYFLCDIISDYIPEVKQDLQTLASLIAQSRIENAVHYPTDIDYGRIVGESLASLFLEKVDNINVNLTKDDYKKLRSSFLDKEDNLEELAEFLLSNINFKNNNASYEECKEAAANFLNGYSDKRITDNEFILDQINALAMANKLTPINCPYKLRTIHKCFKAIECSPGELRSCNSYNAKGLSHCDVNKINDCLEKTLLISSPAIKHAMMDWLHPFKDGNGRLNRIIFLVDTNYDISGVNNFISDQYLSTLNNFIENNNADGFLKM
jgi:hypothetical protein